ncbi:hypothetical protein BSLG_009522 [Batrachochytrium salamandrivorans]|nr:hypothetical protein BSLG_009522 [Batrachochytrium salamandrivorans]
MPRLLLAFDFDYTMVDEDSDVFVFQHLAPDLLTKYKGVQEQALREALRGIAFSPAMKEALELATLHGSEIVIISDANTVYIDTITKAKGIDGYISEVITNTGHFDSNGRLRVQRWTTLPPHECNRCAANLCKGKEILKLIQNRGPFDRVVYLGDGQNDFCPSTKLNGSDLVLARTGRALEKMLKDPSTKSLVQAKIVFWETAEDVLAIFKSLFQGDSQTLETISG